MNVNCWALLAEKLTTEDARLFGRELAKIGAKDLGALERAQVLRAGRPRESLGSCPCDMHDCTRVVERFGGKVYAACPNAMWPLAQIEEDSLRVFTLIEPEFLRHFARANDLKGEVEVLNRYFVVIGHRELPGTSVPVVLARDLRSSTLLEARGIFQARFGAVPSIIVTPSKHRLTEAEVALLTTERRQVLALSAALVEAEGLRIMWPPFAPSVAIVAPAKSATRLVLHMASKTAALDGTPLKLQPVTFKLLHYLALNASPEHLPIPSSVIFERVWDTNSADDVDYFETQVNDHASKIRTAFRRDLGLGVIDAQRLLFNEKRKGFGLSLSPDEILIN